MKHIFILFVKTVIAFLAVMMLSSCAKKYYQVYNTQPQKGCDIKSSAEGYAYETTDYRISYCFWDNNGNPGFIIENKSDEYIKVNLDKSFFIRDGFAYSILSEENKVYGEKNNIGPVYGGIIPPHTSKVFDRFVINRKIYTFCNLQARPKRVESISFTEDKSPLTFGNIINIKVGDKEEEILTHSFYVSKISNYSRKSFNLSDPDSGRPEFEPTKYSKKSLKIQKKMCKKGISYGSKGDKKVATSGANFYIEMVYKRFSDMQKWLVTTNRLTNDEK